MQEGVNDMGQNNLTALADAIESKPLSDAATETAIRTAIKNFTPGADQLGDFSNTDDVLHMIGQVLPDWSVSMTGKAHEPDGHWTCTLRESSWRDSDAVIGIGRGPLPHQALTAALLRVIALQSA